MKRIAGVINLCAVPVVLVLLVSTFTYGQDKSAPASTANIIQSIDVSSQAGLVTVKLGLKDAPTNPPAASKVPLRQAWRGRRPTPRTGARCS